MLFFQRNLQLEDVEELVEIPRCAVKINREAVDWALT